MEVNVAARRVFDAEISESRERERFCLRWKDQIEETLSSIDATNWCRRLKTRAPGRLY